MKRLNFRTAGIEEVEESHDTSMDQIFSQIIGENFPKLRKATAIQMQEPTGHRQVQKRNFTWHAIIKTPV